MAGMFFAGSPTFSSFAVGTIMVVAVAMVGSLTVLPAMMSALGPRVEKGRIPLLHRFRRGAGADSRLWGLLLRGVMRRPKLAAGISTLALLTLAVPVLSMHTALPGNASLPRGLPIVKTYERIQAAFPGGPAPAVVGVQAADVRAAEVQGQISRLIQRAGHTPGLLQPVSVSVSRDNRAETISIPLAGNGTDSRSNAALTRLRALVARDRRLAARRSGWSHGRDRRHGGLQLDHGLAPADRVRVRARDGVPAPRCSRSARS